MSTIKVDTINTRTGSGNITFSRPTVLTAGDIVTADIADDAVTLAKMAGGTDGQIITYDASGDPVVVGPGTDGQVLTSTGAGSPPAFEAAAAGGPTDIKFQVHSAGESNVTGNGTTASLNWNTEIFDIGSDFNVGGSPDAFTAPETGKYLLCVWIQFNAIVVNSATYGDIWIVTSNRTYTHEINRSALTSGWDNQHIMTMTVVADMDTNDTAYVNGRIAGCGSDSIDISSNSVFSGALLA